MLWLPAQAKVYNVVLPQEIFPNSVALALKRLETPDLWCTLKTVLLII